MKLSQAQLQPSGQSQEQLQNQVILSQQNKMSRGQTEKIVNRQSNESISSKDVTHITPKTTIEDSGVVHQKSQ